MEEDKNNKMKKRILILDGVVIAFSLIALVFTFGYVQPMAIAPLDDYVTTNNSVLFSFENADVIYIDDNFEFSSPEKIFAENNLVINLKPGVYYWKLEGAFSSEARMLTINTDIALQLKESGDSYDVLNVGNTLLNVDVYSNETKVGQMKIEPGEKETSNETKFIGGQDG